MKKIILILSALILIICGVGCSNMNNDDVVSTVKSKYLSGYTSKNIGNAIDEYFNDYIVIWSVSHTENEDTYIVEAEIQQINNGYIEFQPNDINDNIMYIKSLYYDFEYDSANDEVNDYVKVYGTILENNQLSFFQTNSVNESYIYLNRLFGQANTNEEAYDHQSKVKSNVKELNSLRNKVRNAKSDEEARQIAVKCDNFPSDLKLLNDNNTSKEAIISIIDLTIRLMLFS